MVAKSPSEIIIQEFGEKIYQKAVDFPYNKINLILIKKDPIKIRSIILEEEREFHLIIDQEKREIFHDCPSFLIYSEKKEKICVHFLKLMLIIEEPIAIEVLNNLDSYLLTSEDFGSDKKGQNFLQLANNCFKSNNCVEGLNYLNKAAINRCNCEDVINRYLELSIKNNLYLEFFQFLQGSYENDLKEYLDLYQEQIKRGFKKFFSSIADYSFFDLLRIIKSMDKILEFNQFLFEESLIQKLSRMSQSQNFNEKYFSHYFLQKYEKKMPETIESDEFLEETQIQEFKQEALDYFFSEIDNFCVIDKLKLLKKQFDVIEIDKEEYEEEYKAYKREIKELEKKVYLKKFAFLKYLIEKYNIVQSRGEFRKKRNTYVVRHQPDNLKNPVYKYIIRRIGFFGTEDTIIKSSEVGINYFIMRELFSDNLSTIPDILYYRTQFWGEDKDYEINPIDGLSLLRKNITYSYEIEKDYSDVEDIMIIEWDLASKPRQASLVSAYGSQITIPDYNNPLFHDLKPFDLTYCKKIPVKIEGNILKTINVISKCSFGDAIVSVSKGMSFIDGFYPLSLVNDVLKKRISPFKANELVVNNPNKKFVPNYRIFIKEFRKYLFEFIKKERDYIFRELRENPEDKEDQIIILLNLTNELARLDLPYIDIILPLLKKEISLKEFKEKFLKEIDLYIQNLLSETKIGSTRVFDLKKMRNTPFYKYANRIIEIRKREAEAQVIKKTNEHYDLSQFKKTYYGRKFLTILGSLDNPLLKKEKFKKILEFSSKLNLNLTIRK